MAKNKNKKKKNKNKNKKKPKVTTYTPKTYSSFPARTEFGRPNKEIFTVEGAKGFPEVHISKKAHDKMWALVQECSIEIGWMSSVVRDVETGNFIIEDVYVPLQECTGTTTVITADGDAELMMELMSAGRTSEINKLKCWGHSHVNMGVFASGTDEDQTDVFIKRFDDFFVRFIGNKKGELLCNIYLMKEGMILNNPDMIISEALEGEEDLDYTEWAEEEIDSKVKRVSYSYTKYSHSGRYNAPYSGTAVVPYDPSGKYDETIYSGDNTSVYKKKDYGWEWEEWEENYGGGSFGDDRLVEWYDTDEKETEEVEILEKEDYNEIYDAWGFPINDQYN